jgi:hypothetical protein
VAAVDRSQARRLDDRCLPHPTDPEETAMPTNPDPHEQLREPHRVDSPDGSRGDGRPTGTKPLEEAPPADAAPTVAPEEQGETPATEHAPGADL